jgi:hypothetical protein
LSPNDLKIFAIGWGTTAALFLVSAIANKDTLSFIGVPVYALLTFAFIIRAKRNEALKMEKWGHIPFVAQRRRKRDVSLCSQNFF